MNTHRLLLLAAVTPTLMAPTDSGCDICAPDLVIESLSCPACNIHPGGPPDPEMPSVEVSVKNAGDAASDGFWLDLFVDWTVAPALGDLSDRYAWVGGLEPGEVAVVGFWGVEDAWVLDAIADSTLRVDEVSESNNIATVFP